MALDQTKDNACTLFVEDFIAVTVAPSALVDEEWKCRACNRLAAHHSHRPLQQQQLLRNEDTAHAAAAAERSNKIMDAWTKELSGLPKPDPRKLKALVETALPTPIPTLDYATALSDEPETDVLKTTDDGKVQLRAGLEGLRASILDQKRHGNSEDTLHAIVENLILAPMHMLASHMRISLRMNRNSVDGSGATLKSLRPDVLTWLPSGVLAFKGEEKATAEELDVATQELSTKLSAFTDTFFGSLHYQLCYALGGEMLQFCAIIRKENGEHELFKLTDATDLSTVRGRSLCVRYVVNITRLLVAMQRSFPDGNAISLGSTVSTQTSDVFILSDHVIKKAKRFTGQKVLTEIYDLLEQSRGVEGLIRVHKRPKPARHHFTVYLEPVGFCGKLPCNLTQLKRAGQRILGALQFLHAHSMVHRDLRPSNIMFADGDWYLVDLECANVANAELGAYCPSESWLPPEISGTNCTWTCACDMWQFGKLVELWGNLDSDGQAYVRVMSEINPSERLSAEASIRHPFFL